MNAMKNRIQQHVNILPQSTVPAEIAVTTVETEFELESGVIDPMLQVHQLATLIPQVPISTIIPPAKDLFTISPVCRYQIKGQNLKGDRVQVPGLQVVWKVEKFPDDKYVFLSFRLLKQTPSNCQNENQFQKEQDMTDCLEFCLVKYPISSIKNMNEKVLKIKKTHGDISSSEFKLEVTIEGETSKIKETKLSDKFFMESHSKLIKDEAFKRLKKRKAENPDH